MVSCLLEKKKKPNKLVTLELQVIYLIMTVVFVILSSSHIADSERSLYICKDW